MKYPMLVTTLTCQELPEVGACCLYNCETDRYYILGPRYLSFVLGLDGKTDPYRIDPRLPREQVGEMLRELEEQELLLHGRTRREEEHERLHILMALREPGPGARRTAAVANRLLSLLWLPALGYCVYVCVTGFHLLFCGGYLRWLVSLLLCCLVGAPLHELGHLCAAVTYGAPVFELGLMLHWFFPGMYVRMDCSGLSDLQQAQVLAGGLETDLLLASLSFLLWQLTGWGLFCGIGVLTLSDVVGNALPLPGLDGQGLLLCLLSALLDALVRDEMPAPRG